MKTVIHASKTRVLDRSVQNCIGSCYAHLVLREDFRNQLRTLQREIGFKYIRFHGIFCDQIGVYTEEKSGSPVYNFMYVDLIYDFLLELGLRPFVELSYMPKALASGSETCFHYEGNTTLPKDWPKWDGLVMAFAKHLIGRYGLTEVRKWRFEVWNEPDIAYFFRGTQAQYFELYAHTARALKSADARLLVGGPATSKNLWIPETLDYCRRTQTPIDFISTHHYCANSAIELNADGTRDRHYHGQPRMLEDVRGTVHTVRASDFPRLEAHYTEWNVTPFFTDSYSKNTEFTAAFVLQTIKDIRGLLDSYSFWTFSDIYEEAGVPRTPFSSQFGMFNFHGIRKCVYHAFHFFAQLFDRELVTRHPSLFATQDGNGHYRLLLWNLSDVRKTDFTGGEWQLDEAQRTDDITIEVPKGRYRVVERRVDRCHGNAYRVWQKLGSPSNPTPEQNKRLARASAPSRRAWIAASEGTLTLRPRLAPCDVRFYDLAKVGRT